MILIFMFVFCLGKVLDFLCPLIEKQPETEKALILDALAKIKQPMTCWTEFLEGNEQSAADDEPEEPEEEVQLTAMETLRSQFSKPMGALLDLCLDLVRGRYLEACRDLSMQQEKLGKLISQEANPSKSGEEPTAMSKELKGMIHILVIVVQGFDTTMGKSVSLSTSLPAPSLINSLGNSSPTDEEAEARSRIWKQVQAERKKFATFSVPKAWSKDGLLACFRQSGKVYTHTGQLNSNHRLILASADILVENGTEPWLVQSVPENAKWKEILDFLSSMNGATDFCLAFDGRMREIRRLHVTRLCL